MAAPKITTPRAEPEEKLSKIIRQTSPGNEIPVLVKQETLENILHHEKNDIKYYDLKTEKLYASKITKQDSKVLSNFYSIHRIAESKSKQQLIDHYQDPKYNDYEKKMLRVIHKKNGKLALLADLYYL